MHFIETPEEDSDSLEDDWALIRLPFIPRPPEVSTGGPTICERYRALIDAVSRLGRLLDDLGEYRWRYPRMAARYKSAQVQMVQCLGWRVLRDLMPLVPTAATALRGAMRSLWSDSLDEARQTLRRIQLGIYRSDVQTEGLAEIVVVLWILAAIERFLEPVELQNLEDDPGEPGFVGQIPTVADLRQLVHGVVFMVDRLENLEEITDGDLLAVGERGHHLAGLYCLRWCLREGLLPAWWSEMRALALAPREQGQDEGEAFGLLDP